jgi:hypothetical protein
MSSSEAKDASPRSALSFSFNVVYYTLVRWLAMRGVCSERFLVSTTFCGASAFCCDQPVLKETLAALRAAVDSPSLLQLTCSLHVPHSTPSSSTSATSASSRLVEGPAPQRSGRWITVLGSVAVITSSAPLCSDLLCCVVLCCVVC